MQSNMNVGQHVGAALVKGNSEQVSEFKPRGFFTIEHWRDGKLLQTQKVPNGVTNVGKNYILGAGFNAVTPINPFYIGIIDDSGGPTLAAGDTMASHAGWTEFTTYSEGTRVDWGEDAAASQAISNTTPATFNITGSATLHGVFLNSDSAKSGTAGTLWATAAFASPIPVVNTDQLKITYTVTAT